MIRASGTHSLRSCSIYTCPARIISTLRSQRTKVLLFKRCCHSANAAASIGAAGGNMSERLRLCDIGANLMDSMYQGEYHGKTVHMPDLDKVLERAWKSGVERIIITATNLQEARDALALAQTDDRLFSTVGVHPTRCDEFECHPDGPQAYMAALLRVVEEGQQCGKVVAIGEFGLDNDRLKFCSRDTQLKWFERQLELSKRSQLPLFLHMRAACAELLPILQAHPECWSTGVVHSFDGTQEEAQNILSMPGLKIGLNGCSLKTERNLKVVAQLPLHRVLLETDAPWCEPRPTHASAPFVISKPAAVDKKKYAPGKLVKGRNEPGSGMLKVLEAVSGTMGQNQRQVAEAAWDNSMKLFFSKNAAIRTP